MTGPTRRCSVERRLLRFLHGRDTRTQLREIHAQSIRHYLHQSNALLTHFISVCSSFGWLRYARLVFQQALRPDPVLFNAMIKAHSLDPVTSTESLRLFALMKACCLRPDRFTFAPLLKSCCHLSHLSIGRGIHGELVRRGLEFYQSIRIGLVELYAGFGWLTDAHKVFDAMPAGDVILWNLMIRGFCQAGDLENGYWLFRKMKKRSVVTWNTMIAGMAHGRQDMRAMDLFQEMCNSNLEPDDATIVTILPVCARAGAIDVGRWIHAYVDQKDIFTNAVNVWNSLLDMYCKCGDLTSARNVFGKIRRKSVISWNILIQGLAINGDGEAGVDMFEEMRKCGVMPNAVTYLGVLGCCTNAGLVERGRDYFDFMLQEHKVDPQLEHYGCMVDLLGHGGHIKESLDLIRGMPMKPSAAIFGALLNSARTHGYLHIAECAAIELINLEPNNSGNYVLLSNIYSETGRWADVERVRLMMKRRKIMKSSGQSMLDAF